MNSFTRGAFVRWLLVSWLASVWLVVATVIAHAAAERRLALVIGNQEYSQVPPLANARNDAVSVTKELKARGFQVIDGQDLDRHSMMEKIDRFISELPAYDVVVFYFSGHGVQIGESNWLLPVDAAWNGSERNVLTGSSISLNKLAADIVAANNQAFTLMIIDACRDNPFEDRSRGLGRPIEVPFAVGALTSRPLAGVMTMYSADANQRALDRLGPADRDPNGVYTRELLKAMRQPGQLVTGMAEDLRIKVQKLARNANHEQRPPYYVAASGNPFMFTPPEIATRPSSQASASPAATASAPAPVVRPATAPRRPSNPGGGQYNPHNICTSLGTC